MLGAKHFSRYIRVFTGKMLPGFSIKDLIYRGFVISGVCYIGGRGCYIGRYVGGFRYIGSFVISGVSLYGKSVISGGHFVDKKL